MSNRKDIPAMISAVGWISSLVDGLYKDLVAKGATPEEINSLVTNGCALPISKLGDVLMHEIRHAENVFQLAIGGDRNTEEVIAAGKYDWSKELITGQNFPMRDGHGHNKIELVYFGCEVTSQEALEEAERRGLLRPDYEDALFFGEQFPEKQTERPIIFLHYPWRREDVNFCVLALNSIRKERRLCLVRFDSRWYDSWFAFVRK